VKVRRIEAKKLLPVKPTLKIERVLIFLHEKIDLTTYFVTISVDLRMNTSRICGHTQSVRLENRMK
jgi:hypothetical protein